MRGTRPEVVVSTNRLFWDGTVQGKTAEKRRQVQLNLSETAGVTFENQSVNQ